jgi:Xaa-Pro aminopeptidase
VYEIKQGLTPELAAALGKDPGESFHFVLNNTTVKDNRIPPRGFTNAAYADFGGARIEEDLLVTADGHRILGKRRPRTIEEVEAVRHG